MILKLTLISHKADFPPRTGWFSSEEIIFIAGHPEDETIAAGAKAELTFSDGILYVAEPVEDVIESLMFMPVAVTRINNETGEEIPETAWINPKCVELFFQTHDEKHTQIVLRGSKTEMTLHNINPEDFKDTLESYLVSIESTI